MTKYGEIRLGCLLRYFNELFRLEICSTCSGAVEAIVKIRKTNTAADSTGIITAPTGRRRRYQSFPLETLREILMELLTNLIPVRMRCVFGMQSARGFTENFRRGQAVVSAHTSVQGS